MMINHYNNELLMAKTNMMANVKSFQAVPKAICECAITHSTKYPTCNRAVHHDTGLCKVCWTAQQRIDTIPEEIKYLLLHLRASQVDTVLHDELSSIQISDIMAFIYGEGPGANPID